MSRDEAIERIVGNMKQLELLVRTFDFGKENDYIALTQYWDKLESSITPLLHKELRTGIGKGRNKKPIRCIETGETWTCAEEVCKDYDVGKESVRRSCSTGITIFKVMRTFEFI